MPLKDFLMWKVSDARDALGKAKYVSSDSFGNQAPGNSSPSELYRQVSSCIEFYL